MMKHPGRRGYPETRRVEAVELGREIGVKAAATQLGVSRNSILRWTQMAVSSSDTAKSALTTRESVVEHKSGIEEPASAIEASTDTAHSTEQSTKTPTKIARRYTPSEKAQMIEYAAKHGVSAAAKEYGCSRFSVYDWQRKVRLAAQGRGDSPTSGESPDEKKSARDKAILDEWHQHPGLGPSQIRNQLRRKGTKVSVTTARRVMEDAGYTTPKVKRHEHNKRYEAVRPNHLWHLDFLHRHINQSSTFTLFLLDDHSRYVVGHGVDDAERANMVVRTFEQAVERYGRPEMVMHDRGSAFWTWRGISRFSRLLEELGIDQVVARDKEHNGKVEVFNANIAKELFDAQRFYDLADMRRGLATHLDWYNHHRTSHALGGLLVPADRYYGRAQEVLARIEAGMGDVDPHAVDLSKRELEFFRVVQNGGVPEVWLLGRKLMSLKA